VPGGIDQAPVFEWNQKRLAGELALIPGGSDLLKTLAPPTENKPPTAPK
jgi:hypothetical protein